MIKCKNCNTEINEETIVCKVCKYPIKGTDDEQAKYIANQIMQESDVKEAVDRLIKSRIILFVLGAVFVTIALVYSANFSSSFDKIFNIVLGLAFIGFGFLTYTKPKIALLIPLIMTVAYFLKLFLVNPMDLMSGAIWKMVVLLGLSYAYISVWKSEKILRENEYLASVIGFGKKGKQ